MLITILLFFGLAAFLVWYLQSKDRGEREPIEMLWAAAGFGFAAMIVAIVFEKFLPGNLADLQDSAASNASRAGIMFGIGLIEEVCKFVPLAFFLYKKRYFNEHTDGILYFALAGIGFGLPENILYTLGQGTGAGVGRLILMPFFHAALTAIPGYYLAKAKLKRKPLWHVAVALGAVVFLHGFYNFGLIAHNYFLLLISLATTISLVVVLFMLIAKAKSEDQAIGLSVVGQNAFCRNCGWPNPKRQLYCERCGKYA
ncbi:hypothetical protein CSA80_02755 [Candidatus Saccharibacteria bacterium]|nr:MAG: hypothetical protein CR973_02870 [Candidatus Saccharibacteria bacterium]PID99011.1 MAG: hypothetical protein CSA80_02755 [Candidatus Saccharibacteria bacterium]